MKMTNVEYRKSNIELMINQIIRNSKFLSLYSHIHHSCHLSLNIKPNVQDISVLDDVIFPFNKKLTGFTAGMF